MLFKGQITGTTTDDAKENAINMLSRDYEVNQKPIQLGGPHFIGSNEKSMRVFEFTCNVVPR
jgi:hypothetical protein